MEVCNMMGEACATSCAWSEWVLVCFKHNPSRFAVENDVLKLKPGLARDLSLKTELARNSIRVAMLDVVESVARRGDHLALEILMDSFGFNADGARKWENLALRVAAKHGRASFLATLADRLNLKTNDARARDNEALYHAAINDDVAVIRVLFDRFGLTVDDLHSREHRWRYHVVRMAESRSNYRAMLHLIARFPGLPRVAAARRAWDAAATASGEPHGWWTRKCSDFYALFIEEARGRIGAEFE